MSVNVRTIKHVSLLVITKMLALQALQLITAAAWLYRLADVKASKP